MITLPIRPRVLRTRLALVGLGAIIAAGALTMPKAHADTLTDTYTASHGPEICADISRRPTDAGIDLVALGILADGLSGSDTGSVLYKAMVVFCPENERSLRHWAKAPALDMGAWAV